MRQKIIIAVLSLCSYFSFGQDLKPVDYVNTLMGTQSKHSLSNGNTYPAVGLPWGMNLWTPQTGKMGDGWAYTYDADKIRGFKQTHQPSPWMNDYGAFAIMPGVGKPKFKEDERASWFSHKAEVATPYSYSVYLADADVTTELTPTERAAYFKFDFPKTDSAYVVIDALDKGSYIKILPKEKKIIGYTTRYAAGKYENFKNYFVVQFDKNFDLTSAWKDNALVNDQLEITSNHAGAIVGFKLKAKESVYAKVASSFISFEQAEINLKREIGNQSFAQVKSNAKDIWSKTLGKIEVKGGTDEQYRTFYSAMYRTLFFPQKLYEIDAQNKIKHWSPYNGKILDGRMFAGTGFWDTFRALYPFLNLVYPSINVEMQEGLANAFKEGGFLPEWSSPGFANVMISNNSASVVADAYIKGLRGYDIETLWKAVVHGANNEGPMDAVGRRGVSYYNSLGYVPYDVQINENAARTLEYAYDDFAIYQLGKALGKPESEISIFKKRAYNYKNVFDPSTGMMRGKNKDGKFQSPFNPFKWGDAFTEGNSWHYTWSVFQDIDGLSKLMGGKKKFEAKLDEVFSLPPVFDDSYYGSVIHEIREMQIMNMGQYAHGNQPIQHMIYLYNYAGAPYKTQYWARQVINKLYKPTPDGYCGDEDNGQTSAWYVFSALGFYPVTPATNQYVLGAPLFKEATIHLENGKKIEIKAPQNSQENIYVQSLKVNNLPYSKNWLNHQELIKGAVLNFDMSAQPNKERGSQEKDFPYSMSTEK
ncbi:MULTISPECIES: GH92 family glycosyl hydrolase [Elizabethkingia]|uniref:GH92 family glycosyl hydrolase n=1 Tax=Elizabethkingia TaxID=308865 RepID=UPI0021A5F828|nr:MULTISPECIES: GH92 family glycosyl hydrolase [Elizabethkingia]MCT3687826.1 glycoside hydrolase family 92 protein [Elizabethkingia anophelis]MCT3706755.1 glycoside hydrolase family 92 protein [Elizabethkingia anophelis]MCT3714046.1 glycoside hydrolase family 92 protein [Elizabethkingia anophelis]MCT3717465.1 glycoside hydrolase family 92 protein [Elizabethkingia anophelis]MCT3731862.1 glycoside hydrolase family 92 protein [Elizabethkingia anophelis]